MFTRPMATCVAPQGFSKNPVVQSVLKAYGGAFTQISEGSNCRDFNIALEDNDVWDPILLKDTVGTFPEERKR